MTGKDRVVTLCCDELEKLIEKACEKAVQRAFHDLGLRNDEPQLVDEARADFMFIRKWRRAVEGAAAKVGGAIILAIVAGALGILWLGFQLAVTAKTGVPTR
ncbi:MAG: hypothetical protein Q8O26_08295 [Phreatobacter sp.]|uniref:hypothetical protein n=1 Tax=Phreatobacter sp. TaxID=1966341 RepID=UPI002735AC63|nr:hypothetical protein [Phreatobacter sp.]MDP2801867.1 hypothetical protein [Phreatobacter sp.]